jgi:predicted  nucleic acid-binding Zn-ribbon protein
MTEKVNISLIKYRGQQNDTLSDILNSVNGYLLRNKGAVSDFNLVKDIVDRNIDKVDDEIGNNLPTPLYLGLMGTMLGIVGGLFFMPEISADALERAADILPGAAENASSALNNASDNKEALGGIDALLNGVKIAMFASVSGLALTILSNYFFFRARRQVEHQKHGFFTFIQTRLLPILSKNTSSSIYSLQTNLLKFNRDFTTNMNSFSSTVNEVRQTFDSQLQVVQELKRIDVANIAKYNIDVMQQLQNSFKKLQDLAAYLDNMNGFIGNTRELNLAINQQLQKVGELSEIINRFDSNAGTISDNSTYLKSHFKNFDAREQIISDRIADFDSNTGKMIDNLEISFHKRLQEFNDKDVEISSGFEKLFDDLRKKTREVFDDESSNIKAIKKDVDNLKNVSSELSGLNQKVGQQDETIKELLNILRDKPAQIKESKLVTIGSIVLAVVGTITCGVILFKFFTL